MNAFAHLYTTFYSNEKDLSTITNKKKKNFFWKNDKKIVDKSVLKEYNYGIKGKAMASLRKFSHRRFSLLSL